MFGGNRTLVIRKYHPRDYPFINLSKNHMVLDYQSLGLVGCSRKSDLVVKLSDKTDHRSEMDHLSQVWRDNCNPGNKMA